MVCEIPQFLSGDTWGEMDRFSISSLLSRWVSAGPKEEMDEKRNVAGAF